MNSRVQYSGPRLVGDPGSIEYQVQFFASLLNSAILVAATCRFQITSLAYVCIYIYIHTTTAPHSALLIIILTTTDTITNITNNTTTYVYIDLYIYIYIYLVVLVVVLSSISNRVRISECYY